MISAAGGRTGETRRRPAVLSWSTGKDSAFALHQVRRAGTWDVIGLLTTVESRTGRVATHGIRGTLLTQQGASVGIPLTRVALPRTPSNAVYEEAMASALEPFREQGVRHVIFGDLFLADIRAYRERQMGTLGMECVFPLWGMDTGQLSRQMIGSGLEARVVSVDRRQLPRSAVGRRFDAAFLRDLPPTVDPCGENGEFHTFVTAGPMLQRRIPVKLGPVEERNGFAAIDLFPAGKGSAHTRQPPVTRPRPHRRKA